MRDILAPAEPAERERWLLDPMLDLAGHSKDQTAWSWHHSGRVSRYAILFGKAMGLDRASMLALQCASLLHDVGKITLPAELLDKSSGLSREEWYTITKHSMASSIMMKAQQIPTRAIAMAQAHHEWYDGNGYPRGLEGDSIPLGARILSVADSYDAMCSDRPYRPALTPEQISEQLVKGAGKQFDPTLVRVLLPLICKNPDSAIPTRRMRVISYDLALIESLWFAAYPLGWELNVWPDEWAGKCPPDLLGREGSESNVAVDLTVIDGRSINRVPHLAPENIAGNTLWIDPVAETPASVARPLDLGELLPYLDIEPGPDVARNGGSEHTKVLIADPFQLFRQALRVCLNENGRLQVVQEVRSPKDLRQAQHRVEYDLVLIASDFLIGSRSPVAKRLNEELLTLEEARGEQNNPAIVLVADEDFGALPYKAEWNNSESCLFIDKGATIEALLDAISRLESAQQPDNERR